VLSGIIFLFFLAKPVVIQGLLSTGPKSSRHQRGTAGLKEVSTLQSSVYDENEAPPIIADYDDADGDDIISDSFLASPLSQSVFSEEEEKDSWYPGSFSRQENWLEEASADMMDLEKIPLGTLNEEDVESITGLMSAWVRRRSLEAALSVERLLKRVVDDMREGNSDVHVTARMYTIVSPMKAARRFQYTGGHFRIDKLTDIFQNDRQLMHGLKVVTSREPREPNKFMTV
jgi:hypothetical protein